MNMDMGSTTSMPSMTSSMPMASSTSASGSGSMSGMDMGMNYYLTPTYRHYPVLFQHLSADTRGKAFGIFLLIVVAAFVYKFLLFVSWCLEVHWFKRWNKTNKYSTLQVAKETNNVRESGGKDYYADAGFDVQTLPKIPNFMFDVFSPSLIDLFHDLIRALLTFTATMIIYMLMLAAMSFVLTYVFAVITGLTFAEVFFNRCKICMLKRWDIQREIKKTTTCPGTGDCQCGRHEWADAEVATVTSDDQGTRIQDKDQNEKGCCPPVAAEPKCCCTEKAEEDERNIETNILESSKLQEQAGNMDSNLMPAEKFQ
ncbi:hypothetical protein HG536_0C02380 [Torulaspora globosa]|uniref:Copper transport protein n=1 Tax=Torulaspora globosa TaxID=48254 RepID=A0A7G3ZEY3_9SACH|nr:uncharacterized protein HG536_0C02380 [Torulaspora globosa]QLL32069.1 hypothetical protein HG536_0C02380 [Torulaspora globosa]